MGRSIHNDLTSSNLWNGHSLFPTKNFSYIKKERSNVSVPKFFYRFNILVEVLPLAEPG
jgi:hypothetical protein